jgi:hypothetical protein
VLPLRSRAALVSPLLDVASVRYVLTRRDLLADLAAAGLGDGGFALAEQRGEARVYENREALPFATIVPEALLLPAAPADDAIAVPADAEPLRRDAESDERARLQAAALQDQAGAPASPPAASSSKGRAGRRRPRRACDASPRARRRRGGRVATLALRGGAVARRVDRAHGDARVVVRLAEGGDGGFLRLSEGFDPGWTATADGRPLAVLPADVAFAGRSI